VSAVDTIDHLASGAASAWRGLSATGTGGAKPAAAGSDSFADLLSAHAGRGEAKGHHTAPAAPAAAADRLIDRLA
jgi:hypothetical protein